MFYVISPLETTGWRFDRRELIALLKRDWPGIEITGPEPSLAARDVVWAYEDHTGSLEGSQDVAGRAHYLDGTTEMVVRYAVWWREIAPNPVDLALYDESFTTIIRLPIGISEAEVFRQLAG